MTDYNKNIDIHIKNIIKSKIKEQKKTINNNILQEIQSNNTNWDTLPIVLF